MKLTIHPDLTIKIEDPGTKGFPVQVFAQAGVDGKVWCALLGPPTPGDGFKVGRTFKRSAKPGQPGFKTFSLKVPGIYEFHCYDHRIYLRVEQDGNAMPTSMAIAMSEASGMNPMYQAKARAQEAATRFTDAIETLAKISPTEAADVMGDLVTWIEGGALTPGFDPGLAVEKMQAEQETELEADANKALANETDKEDEQARTPNVFHF